MCVAYPAWRSRSGSVSMCEGRQLGWLGLIMECCSPVWIWYLEEKDLSLLFFQTRCRRAAAGPHNRIRDSFVPNPEDGSCNLQLDWLINDHIIQSSDSISVLLSGQRQHLLCQDNSGVTNIRKFNFLRNRRNILRSVLTAQTSRYKTDQCCYSHLLFSYYN